MLEFFFRIEEMIAELKLTCTRRTWLVVWISVFIALPINTKAQDICNADGNVMIYSNYEGGDLTINIDLDIPDLKIGICTYEFTDVTLTGAYVANVTQVVFAGFNAPVISGVDPSIVSVYAAAIGDIAVTSVLGDVLYPGFPPIVNCMVGAEGCGETASGGGNSSPQIVDFFMQEFDDDDIFYAHYTDYDAFPAATFYISDGGNCCYEEPITDVNPIYDAGGLTYAFFEFDTALLCDGELELDISFYPVVWGDPVWSTGETGYTIIASEPGVYSFVMSDYCHYGDFLLTDTVIIEPCATEVMLDLCVGELYTLPDGTPVISSGIYEVILTAADGSDSLVLYNVTLHPNYIITSEVAICAGDVYLLPDGTETSTPGSYFFLLYSVYGCDSATTIILDVIAPVTASVSDSFCPGGTYTFPDGTMTNTTGIFDITIPAISGCDSIITYTLSLSDTVEIINNVTICTDAAFTLEDGTEVNSAGIYNVYVFPPFVDCITKYITHLSVEPPANIAFDVPDFYCESNGLLLLNATPAGGVYNGAGVSGNEFNPAITGPGGPLSFTYTFTSALGCVTTATDALTVTFVSAEAGEDILIILGDSAVLNVFTSGTPVWSPAESLSCATCTNPVASPTVTTTYTVTVTDVGGCVATDQVTVIVDPDPEFTFFVPNAFTPNKDGINDFLFVFSSELLLI
ncbi:MAG: hypothetical protein ACK4IY_01815, partial [Chitinophagales bacterium]